MENLLVFMHYEGQWDDDLQYINFKVTSIQIPKEYIYEKLITAISECLKFEEEKKEIQISYKVKEEYPALKIEDDFSLLFYIELKNKKPECTKYPLCISLQKKNDSNILQNTPPTIAAPQNLSTDTRTIPKNSDIV